MGIRRVEEFDEPELVRRAQEGDRVAFGELVRLHQDEVFTLALRLVGNHELAADVAQEAFVRAWRAVPRFRGDARFSTWIHRITVNTAWTMRRRAFRHAAVPLDEAEATVVDPRSAPESAGENIELRAHLRRALASLPEAQRAVVVLKDVYGWSHHEIAEELGITVTAAKVRLHRARRRLRGELWGMRP